MDYPREVFTERLHLLPMVVDDADELFRIFSDPEGWWYDPTGRHTDITTTVSFIEGAAKRWDESGLSYWTARQRSDDAIVGLGGAQPHRSGSWNLNYRTATTEQGKGLATEIAVAARDAALWINPDIALVAWIAEINMTSRRVAERLGLANRGARRDVNDGTVRLAYSDRPLGEESPPS